MQHIVSSNEVELHKIEDEHGAECSCMPDVKINPNTGDMFVIHKSFDPNFEITEEDIKGIFEFAATDPEYEGGNIYVDEAED